MVNFSKNKTFLAFCTLAFGLLFTFLLIKWQIDNKNEPKQVSINVYNWGNHISDGSSEHINVNAEFERRTGIKVNYSTYQDNESLYAKIMSSATKYDVIIPSDYMVAKLIEKNMLRKMDFSKMPNTSTIDKEFLNPSYDPQNEYSVPYTWGVVGIFYNKSLVSESPEEMDWDILWNPKYKGRIMMFENSPRDAFGIALMKLGLSINTIDPQDLKKAAAEMARQKPLIKGYVTDQVFEKIGIGEAALAPYYTDAYIVTSGSKDLGLAIPKGITNKFVNAMCICANSDHPDEAQQYINFICDIEIATENIKHVGYCTPQQAVRERLDPEISQNKSLYPDKEILSRSHTYENLPDETNALMNDLWLKTRIENNNSSKKFICILLGLFLVYLGLSASKIIKKRKGNYT
ncbi:MAG: spermidine/putrescine ABC transporter substrate-binding protein [Oscillospiraceae bacterium]|nr:spermidine/putrescine ABC transporter substrate-binding protein [Oscillospiraceae bacterium]